MEINGKLRITEIQDMRSKLAQGYLKMVATDNWFEVVKKFVCVNPQYSDNLACIELYGPEKYTIDMMDCSLMNGLVSYCKEFKRHVIPSKIFNSLINILDDRNYYFAHLNSNESEYQLYSQGLRQLDNFRFFIELVRNKDNGIDSVTRSKYYNYWDVKLKDFKAQFEVEYVQVVNCNHEYTSIEKRLINSSDPEKAWNNIWLEKQLDEKLYSIMMNISYRFCIEHPEMVITGVYRDAIHYLSKKGDIQELEYFIVKYCNSLSDNKFENISLIKDDINKVLIKKDYLSEFDEVINSILNRVFISEIPNFTKKMNLVTRRRFVKNNEGILDYEFIDSTFEKFDKTVDRA